MSQPAPHDQGDDFAREAEAAEPGLLREVFDLLRENKRWWQVPVVVALLIMGLLVVLGQTAALPFIYTLF